MQSALDTQPQADYYLFTPNGGVYKEDLSAFFAGVNHSEKPDSSCEYGSSNMAATVNHRKYPEPEEDIAAIAKQISDHAEAIYQNWKSRGLAPTEILSCNNISGSENFGKTLSAKKPVDILGSSSNLEQLVNNFVVEDKARIARQRSSSPVRGISSSVQFAKQKFETREKAPSPVRENVLKVYPKPSTTPSYSSPKAKRLSQFIGDTIEQSLPEDLVKPSAGLQTWPLKNKTIGADTVKNKITSVDRQESSTLDEVAKEEERLINALKTGMIITEEPSERDSKPDLLQKKLLKKPTGLVKMVVKSYQEQAERDSTDYSQVNKKLLRSTRRPNESAVPHPELTGAQKQHIRTNSTMPNPVRPFLTRGSVAERVLIFEKCPSELGLDKRKPGPPNYSRDSVLSPKAGPPPHTTLQRHARANKNLLLPRFHFPYGKSTNQTERHLTQEAIRLTFQNLPNQQATIEQFGPVAKACGCPLYWKAPLFIACGGERFGYVEVNMVLDYWRELSSNYHDIASRFFHILNRGQRNYLLPDDFVPLVQDVVDTHPGLSFLKEAVEFHSRYVHTVIARIYYCVNNSWTSRITLPELRKSNLLSVIALLEKESDINQVTQYFSYEHFYVIYCKYWELDRDHDLYIDKHDLARHSDHALSTRIIDRIFSGAVTRGKRIKPQDPSVPSKMSYTEFVFFLLAEEDKSHPRAIEYWFRCMDLDGDGYLSMYELEYFYDEQLQRMEAIGIECLPFNDCLCQMLDMIRPETPGKISLADLKRCKMTPIFFDTFFNLEKYLDHEQRDPFASQRDHESEMSDWDRYAAEEYELLVAEEGGSENQEGMVFEYNSEDDIFSPNLDEMFSGNTYMNNNNSKMFWNQPSVTVTTYEDLDSPDYADSDSSL